MLCNVDRKCRKIARNLCLLVKLCNLHTKAAVYSSAFCLDFHSTLQVAVLCLPFVRMVALCWPSMVSSMLCLISGADIKYGVV